jgi:hypothetical protein
MMATLKKVLLSPIPWKSQNVIQSMRCTLRGAIEFHVYCFALKLVLFDMAVLWLRYIVCQFTMSTVSGGEAKLAQGTGSFQLPTGHRFSRTRKRLSFRLNLIESKTFSIDLWARTHGNDFLFYGSSRLTPKTFCVPSLKFTGGPGNKVDR